MVKKIKLHKKAPIPDLSGNIVFDMLIIAIVLYLVYQILQLLGNGVTSVSTAVTDAVKYVADKAVAAKDTITGVDSRPHGVLTTVEEFQAMVPAVSADGVTGNDDAGSYQPTDDVTAMVNATMNGMFTADQQGIRSILSKLNGWQFVELYQAFGLRPATFTGLDLVNWSKGALRDDPDSPDLYSMTDVITRVADVQTQNYLNTFLIGYVTDGKGRIAGM